MTTPQEDFVAGAEAWATEHGERHGYGMLAAGLEHLLKTRSYDFTEREIANMVHHHYMGEFLNQGSQPETVDLSKLAHRLDMTYARTVEPSWDLRNVLEGRSTAGLFYRRAPQLDWIEREVADELKKRKIRRGTKRHVEFVEANREKIVTAATDAVRSAAKNYQASLMQKLEQFNKDRDNWVQRVSGIERQLAFRRALLDVTETQADPKAEKGAQDLRDIYARAIAALDESINYVQVQYAEAENNVEEVALEAVRASKELAPFAGGSLCGCN